MLRGTAFFLVIVGLLCPARAASTATAPTQALPVVILSAPFIEAPNVDDRDRRARELLNASGERVLPRNDQLELLPAPFDEESFSKARAGLEDLKDADALFYAMENDAALRRYERGFSAVLSYPEALAETADSAPPLLDHALRYARLLEQSGRESAKAELFADMARVAGPNAEPNPAEHPGPAIAEFIRARDTLWARRSPLRVATPSENCVVFVDGRRTEPYSQQALGSHRVVLRCGQQWAAPRTAVLSPTGLSLAIDPAVDRGLKLSEDGVLTLPLAKPDAPDVAWLSRCVAGFLSMKRVAFVDGHASDFAVLVFRVSGESTEVEKRLSPPRPALKAPKRIWTWVAAGTGAALMGLGGYFHWATLDATRDINHGMQALERREDNRTMMGVFYGLGAAALVGSVVLYFVEPGLYDDENEDFVLVPSPSGVHLVGRW